MCNDTDAIQDEIDQALEEDFPGYLASFDQACGLYALNQIKDRSPAEGTGGQVRDYSKTHRGDLISCELD